MSEDQQIYLDALQMRYEGIRLFNNRDEARKAKGPDETVVKVGQFADGTFGLKSSRGPMMNVYAIVKQKPRIRPPK